VPQVVAQLRGDAEVLEHHPGDVLGGVGDALDRHGHRQHAGELVGVVAGPGGDHAHRPQLDEQLVDALLEAQHLAGERVVAEEDRRVGQVDHQLGGVLGPTSRSLTVRRSSWSPSRLPPAAG
jgi:hypothetical protein